jgi:hypothetical protein
MNEIRKEELLWKYVDNICNDQEREEVQSLLATNTDFRMLFDEISMVDQLLKDTKKESFSENFKLSLEQKLTSEMGKIDFSPVTIIPKYMKISLFILSIMVVVLTFIIPESKYNQVGLFTMPEVSEVVFYNIIAITGGIIFLWTVDKYLHKYKKTGHKLHFFML